MSESESNDKQSDVIRENIPPGLFLPGNLRLYSKTG